MRIMADAFDLVYGPHIAQVVRERQNAKKWLLWSIAGLLYGAFCIWADLNSVSYRSELGQLVLLTFMGGCFLCLASIFGICTNLMAYRNCNRKIIADLHDRMNQIRKPE